MKKGSEIKQLHVVDPATGDVFATVEVTTESQLEAAVVKARAAQPGWAALEGEQRREMLLALAKSLRLKADVLAEMLVREQGKPLAAAHQEVSGSAARIEGLCDFRISPERIFTGENVEVTLNYRPIGVVGCIAPWNFPLVLAVQLVVQALITGNVAILKPSELTPLTTRMFGDLAQDILPEGVLSVLIGDGHLGRLMSEHEDIDKIAFIGSTATGKKVMASASGNLKRVSLELGGNDAAVVMADAKISDVAPKLFRAAFMNSGQICMGIKRLYVDNKIRIPLVQALKELAEATSVGNGMEPDVTMGPVQNKAQYEKVLGLIEDAKHSGGTIICGGKALKKNGYFIEPTLICDVREGVRLVDEEQFGPVLPIMGFDTVEEAIERANSTHFGLGASVWCHDETEGRRVAAQLKAGTVWLNQHAVARSDAPFGGIKQSGIGRALGDVGLKSYMEAQVDNFVCGEK